MPGICDKLSGLRTENTKETELSFPELARGIGRGGNAKKLF